MNKKIVGLSTFIVLLIAPSVILALTITDIVTNVMNTATAVIKIIATGFVIIMFILAGFKYLTAQGNPQQVIEANKAVIWALAGIAVVVLASLMQGIVCLSLGLGALC